MSMIAIIKERSKALELLGRINEGDSSAELEIGEFLKKIRERERNAKADRDAKEQRLAKRRNGGRKNSGEFEIAKKEEGGVDFGAIGLVLAKASDGKRLVWRQAHTAYIDRGTGSVYCKASLCVLDGKERLGIDISRREDPWRMTLGAKTIMRYAEKIDSMFGAGTAVEVAKLKGTVIL